MLLHDLAHRTLLLAVLVLLERFDVRRRRRWRRAEKVFENPGAAQYRRRAVRVRRRQQHRALAEQAPAVGIRERDATEAIAPDIRNAVVQREPLVDERVVGGEQLENRAILSEDAVHEQFHFTAEGGAQAVVEVREDDRVRIDLFECPHLQPLKGETGHERFGSRIGQQSTHLRFENSRRGQRTALGRRQQFIVGGASDQEERETRRQFNVANRVNAARRKTSRRSLRAIQELRARENRRQRIADRGVEVTKRAGGAVELDRRV